MIPRIQAQEIESKLGSGKAIVVLGPRQTGKTTVLESILAKTQNRQLVLNCDDPEVRDQLTNINTERLRQIIGPNKIVFIDEAQRIKNIGITLKLITDQFKNVQLLVTGSSSLEIASEINEPLTGRKREYFLFPISWKELNDYKSYLPAKQQLEQRLIYGMYPEVINQPGEEAEVLKELCESYLYKDILSLEGIRRPQLLEKILKALALQLGNEISFNELASLVQADKNTVMNYIDLLEKAFVIHRLQPLSRNLRNEISTSRKIYFYDNGIRNALIANFNPVALRQDSGSLWENFLISERMKYLHYNKIIANRYFWRTHAQQEIDYIEERGGKLSAYEFKWNTFRKVKIPSSFIKAYPGSDTTIIHSENFESFLGV